MACCVPIVATRTRRGGTRDRLAFFSDEVTQAEPELPLAATAMVSSAPRGSPAAWKVAGGLPLGLLSAIDREYPVVRSRTQRKPNVT